MCPVAEEKEGIEDRTATNLTNLRRVIYLTIMNALNYEEAVHKLLKVQLSEGQEVRHPVASPMYLADESSQIELAKMIIECCSQERSYSTFYGLVGERFSKLNRVWTDCFEEAFTIYYDTIHQYETNRLRNIARFFGHLFSSDAISWNVLRVVKVNEDDTTSSSRIFIKIMMQEMMEAMSLKGLAERLKDPEIRDATRDMFPMDVPKNTRFSINYFTSIGLGLVTEDMREYLKVGFGVWSVLLYVADVVCRTHRRLSWSSAGRCWRTSRRAPIQTRRIRTAHQILTLIPTLTRTASTTATAVARARLLTSLGTHRRVAAADTSALCRRRVVVAIRHGVTGTRPRVARRLRGRLLLVAAAAMIASAPRLASVGIRGLWMTPLLAVATRLRGTGTRRRGVGGTTLLAVLGTTLRRVAHGVTRRRLVVPAMIHRRGAIGTDPRRLVVVTTHRLARRARCHHLPRVHARHRLTRAVEDMRGMVLARETGRLRRICETAITTGAVEELGG